jgi:hypothetical protein
MTIMTHVVKIKCKTCARGIMDFYLLHQFELSRIIFGV